MNTISKDGIILVILWMVRDLNLVRSQNTSLRCRKLLAPENGYIHIMNLAHLTLGTIEQRIQFSCDIGHVLVGNEMVECGQSGLWVGNAPDGTEPKCLKIRCSLLSLLINGDFSPRQKRYTFGDAVTYRCNATYDLIGSPVLLCGEDGLWSDHEPQCVPEIPGRPPVNCDPPLQKPEFGSINSTLVSVGTHVKIACNAGYILQGVPQVACMAGGQWSANIPTCQMVPTCPPLGGISSFGSYYPTHQTTPGTEVTYECIAGFFRHGPHTITCLTNGRWSGYEPECIEITQCPRIDTTPGITFHPLDIYKIGSSVSFSCEAGLRLQGSQTITCRTIGNGRSGWDANKPPSCVQDMLQRRAYPAVGIPCRTVTTPQDGTMSPLDSPVIGMTLHFSCNAGFEMIGPERLTCEPSSTINMGQWNGQGPTCVPARNCPGIIFRGGTFVPIEHTNSGTVVHFSCEAGRELIGSTNSTCMPNGNWSSPTPLCVKRRCPSLEVSRHGSLFPKFTEIGTTVTFACYSGYILFGAQWITRCQADGTWSTGVSPRCLKDAPSNNNVPGLVWIP